MRPGFRGEPHDSQRHPTLPLWSLWTPLVRCFLCSLSWPGRGGTRSSVACLPDSCSLDGIGQCDSAGCPGCNLHSRWPRLGPHPQCDAWVRGPSPLPFPLPARAALQSTFVAPWFSSDAPETSEATSSSPVSHLRSFTYPSPASSVCPFDPHLKAPTTVRGLLPLSKHVFHVPYFCLQCSNAPCPVQSVSPLCLTSFRNPIQTPQPVVSPLCRQLLQPTFAVLSTVGRFSCYQYVGLASPVRCGPLSLGHAFLLSLNGWCAEELRWVQGSVQTQGRAAGLHRHRPLGQGSCGLQLHPESHLIRPQVVPVSSTWG